MDLEMVTRRPLGASSTISWHTLVSSVAIGAFLLASLVLSILVVQQSSATVFWPTARTLCLLGGAVFCVSSLLYISASRERLLGPIGLFLGVLVVWFGVRAIVIAVTPSAMVHTDALSISDKWLATLYALSVVALWAITAIGFYHSPVGKWIERQFVNMRLVHRIVDPSAVPKALLLYCLGVVGNGYRILTGTHLGMLQARPQATRIMYETGYDPVAIILGTVLPIVGSVALVVVVVLTVRDGRWLVLTAVMLVESIYGFLSGVRGGLLMTGGIVILSLYLYRRVRLSHLLMISPVLILAGFAVIAPYRYMIGVMNLAGRPEIDATTIGEHLSYTWDLGWTQIGRGPVSFIGESVLSRFAGLDRFAAALGTMWDGQAGFVYGETFLSGALSSAPRLIFSERPVLNIGYWFHVEYLRAPWDTQTVVPMARVIEFYINFGVIGIVLGGALMGSILRGLRGLLVSSTTVGVVLYVFSASEFILLAEKPLSVQLGLWKVIVVLLVMLWWLTRKTDSLARRRAP